MKVLAVVLFALTAACSSQSAPRPTKCSAPAPLSPIAGDPSWQEKAKADRALLAKYTKEHEDTFAGAWLDDARQKIVVAFTDDPAGHRTALRKDAKDPEVFDVVKHAASRKSLEKKAASIIGDNDSLKGRGLVIASVGINDRANRVSIELANPTKDATEFMCTVYGHDLIFERVDAPASSSG